MRCIVGMGVLVLAAASAGAARQASGQELLEQARRALGGEALAAVRTLRVEGQSTRVVGPLRLSSAVELLLDRPDRFLRIDRLRLAGSSAETLSGFDGDRFIQRTPGQHASWPGNNLPFDQRNDLMRAAGTGLRKELTLLLLGFFAGTFDGSPLQVERIGLAEAPDGRADALRLTFGDGSTATLFIHVDTHLPLMVSWQGSDPAAALRVATTADASATSALIAAAQAPLVEHRLHFGDYRRVNALRWPFLVRRTGGGAPMEELRLEKVTLNPVVNASAFAGDQ